MMEFYNNLIPSLLCLFLFCSTTSCVSALVFLSIDCGSSAPAYTDERGIVWTSDEKYIKTGQSYTTQTISRFTPRVMDTLRAFTTQKKNCYTIPEASKGLRVLVRVEFFYGNYDQKSLPPTFDLLFDGNKWATVETSLTDSYYYEVIYTVRGDALSVCVAQTKIGQFPFISSIEVRSLDSAMYNNADVNYPLLLWRRFAYGAPTSYTISYPNDPYDRYWRPDRPTASVSVSNDASTITTGHGDQPPSSVLKNAVTGLLTDSSIFLDTPPFPSGKTLIYVNMYFSEVKELLSTEVRAFNIYQDDQSLTSSPVVPPYGDFRELVGNITVTQGTQLSLVPTSYSTLAPIINAMEIFGIGDQLNDGTDKNDVQGLASLQDAFNVLQDWSGDPCLPFPYSWDWISCSSDTIPRVTALDLSSFGLSGLLPNFSSMVALQIIDLHNNSLSGPIPDFLGTLPNLKQLNLANNKFNGTVPASLTQKNNLNLVLTGNPDLCTSSCNASHGGGGGGGGAGGGGGGGKKASSKLPIILSIAIPSFVIIVWVTAAIIFTLRKRRQRNLEAAGAIPPPHQVF